MLCLFLYLTSLLSLLTDRDDDVCGRDAGDAAATHGLPQHPAPADRLVRPAAAHERTSRLPAGEGRTAD